MLVHCVLAVLAPEEVGELVHRVAVRDARRHVRPLAWVETLREEPAELSERRPFAQDPVRVVVDEPDLGQYFEKWPCCSNVSPPAE